MNFKRQPYKMNFNTIFYGIIGIFFLIYSLANLKKKEKKKIQNSFLLALIAIYLIDFSNKLTYNKTINPASYFFLFLFFSQLFRFTNFFKKIFISAANTKSFIKVLWSIFFIILFYFMIISRVNRTKNLLLKFNSFD